MLQNNRCITVMKAVVFVPVKCQCVTQKFSDVRATGPKCAFVGNSGQTDNERDTVH